jgi:hypothetical protein
MNKPFTVAAVVIFAIVALMHLLRFVLGWDANIAGTEIPMWVSRLENSTIGPGQMYTIGVSSQRLMAYLASNRVTEFVRH